MYFLNRYILLYTMAVTFIMQVNILLLCFGKLNNARLKDIGPPKTETTFWKIIHGYFFFFVVTRFACINT